MVFCLKNSKNLSIPREKMEEGFDLCRKNVLDYLQDARLIIGEGRLNHALVSVQFSIEELGKIRMLREALNKSAQGNVLVKESVFKSHKGKSETAWEFLDVKFRTIFEGDFDETDFSHRDFLTDTKASHETRLECAFVGFDGNEWFLGREIDKTLLLEIIQHIKDKLPEA